MPSAPNPESDDEISALAIGRLRRGRFADGRQHACPSYFLGERHRDRATGEPDE